tara:strand:+ start:3475 stop:4758 length:1284 start_codon:yes stop_codon:yes gene_type:complete
MSIEAFKGGAGCGKTYSVMEQLNTQLVETPLLQHQRVLALTYMHGARHQLDELLEGIADLKGRYEASTIDSFAWTVCRRWRARIDEMGLVQPENGDFENISLIATQLLEDPLVAEWVANSYPIVLIDEAQDLDFVRLRIVQGLLETCCIILAFDEFQCLNSENRPVAVLAWIEERCTPTSLEVCRRTDAQHLLLAASQVRSGQPLTADGVSFRVKILPERPTAPHRAVTAIGYEIMKGGSFALISPVRKERSQYLRGITDLLQTKLIGAEQRLGPFPVVWEGSGESRVQEVRDAIAREDAYSFEQIEGLLAAFIDLSPTTSTLAMLKRARDAGGVTEFPKKTIQELFERNVMSARQFTRRTSGGRRAMTVHQAKNREFDRVVLIWPYELGGDDDSRRRTFYNAITRAKSSCLVIVQSQRLLERAPFV